MRKCAPSSAAIVATAVLATRLPVLLCGAIAVWIVGTIPPPAAEAVWRVSSHEVANLLARWDTFYYYTISTEGYSWDPAVFRHYNVVFFPLYPMLMRGGGIILGGHPLLAGLIISLTAFAGALVLLYRLAELELGDDYAWRVILLISTFPYALYFLGGLHGIAVSAPQRWRLLLDAARESRLGRAVRAGGRPDAAQRILAGAAAGSTRGVAD